MANITRSFSSGVMNKMVDDRLIPNGQYVDALNVRMGSTETSEVGVVENSKGNSILTGLSFEGTPLSDLARCIGAYADGSNETLYWFVHDSNFTPSSTGKIDMVVSYDTKSDSTVYHIISVDDGDGINTTLNFDPRYLVTGVDKIEDLLFFTDNHTDPKKINVTRNYANPILGVDGFSLESVLVIKKPPTTAPTIVSVSTPSQDNFLEDRFVCFAYRYRYEDGEYSATSQFSNPSFIPKTFDYSVATALNEGMLNSTNMCNITYNSGGPLVKSVDLLFKDMNSSVIKIIEKINKEDSGIANDQEYTFSFQNSKIFTILPSSEILRLYDNVPLLSESQTLMGNRLMYGNYLEGYDLKDRFDNPTQFNYTVNFESELVGYKELGYTTPQGVYTLDVPTTVSGSTLEFDLTDQVLAAGAVLSFIVRYSHQEWSGSDIPYPSEDTEDITINFIYTLTQSFGSALELSQSPDFQFQVGVANTDIVADSCSGGSFTDIFNCSIPNELANGMSSVFKYASGVTGILGSIAITSPSANVINLQLPAMQFVDDPTGVAITYTAYEYYKITLADISFQTIGDPKSLHSNRGYEIGIVYMDEYNRMSTALVSPENNIHIPCENSDTANRIMVNIPTIQVAPYWAKRYKFVIKPDKKDYNIIYTNFFFRDPTTGSDFFLLDGQNSTKIEEGDQLIIKTDTQGPLRTCANTTVLEKKAQLENFLTPPPADSEGVEIPVPAGTYMKLNANNFSTETGDLPVIAYGMKTKISNAFDGPCPEIKYPVDTPNPSYDPAGPADSTNPKRIPYPITPGTHITIFLSSDRRGKAGVEEKHWEVTADFVSPVEYPSFREWFDGENIANTLDAQSQEVGGVSGPNYDPAYPAPPAPCVSTKVTSRFLAEGLIVNGDEKLFFVFKGSKGYTNRYKSVKAKMKITVVRSFGTIAFESIPLDAEPDLWYESDESFPIDELGQHSGNFQDQNLSSNLPAIINTSFFNCYSFGNGVESYKIQDSIIGKELVLGNRATTTNSKLYGAEQRFSDITYSGVYNTESNINKLNEFNVGLLNFKLLESSFGPINKLFARETDILTLQEDKISYVLGGKNLLSDAGGGSALLSVPEVLGIQIARVEDYGISHNPESFVEWGSDKFFTDAKRGAVLNLKGQGNSEQLAVISQAGMRPWFRDLFNSSFQTQKLGGFDPYMNEYVLASNAILTPVPESFKNCGFTETIIVTDQNPYTYTYDLGNLVGTVDVDYSVLQPLSGTFTVTAVYNGVTTTTGPVTANGTLSFDKDDILADTVQISITATDTANITLNVKCPLGDTVTVVLVSISSPVDIDKQIHNQYRWTDNTFQSPIHSDQVTFLGGSSPVVSLYQTITGPQGGGVIPSNNADVIIMSNKVGSDTYDFNMYSDSFKYLRSNTLYNNTTSEINALILASAASTPINPPANGNTDYNSTFTMPTVGDYLYLVWDYRNSTPIDLCFAVLSTDACCDCAPASAIYQVRDCETATIYTVEDTYLNGLGINSTVQFVLGIGVGAGTFVHCGEIIGFGTVPDATLFSNETQTCGDTINCNFESSQGCTTYSVSSFGNFPEQFCYTPCDGSGYTCIMLDPSGGGDSETVCAVTGSATYSGPIGSGGSCP